MCPIEQRETKEIMDNERYTQILHRFLPYLEHQKLLSFCGLGEPLIDRYVYQKVEIAKQLGFQGIGIYTNGEILRAEISARLLDAGLDTLIVSIDGYTDQVQSAIRIRSSLGVVVQNVERFIALRNSVKSNTRVIIRFTKQSLNRHEEYDFCRFWQERINHDSGDKISVYNVHNAGGSVANSIGQLSAEALAEIRKHKLRCSEIYERVLIRSDGALEFCCGDQFEKHRIGNILLNDLVVLYNSSCYKEYRREMEKGNILELELCKNCSVAHSIATREIGVKRA